MAKEKLPFFHEDISVLARSLKQQLASRNQPPTHVEVLNMLAHATGARNYQNWRLQKQVLTIPDHVELYLTLHGSCQEVFRRDPESNEILDRRHKKVSHIYVIRDVEIRFRGLTGVMRTKASVAPDLLPDGQDPEIWTAGYLPVALGELIQQHPESISIFGTVELAIDKAVRAGKTMEFSDNSLTIPMTISEPHFSRLREECEDSDRAAKGFERIKKLLWELMGAPVKQAALTKVDMLATANYLQEYLEAEADLFMGSWNREKLGRIIRLLTAAAKNTSGADPEGWSWARRDAYAAYAPAHWHYPVYPPDSLISNG